jgi:hypothetical protein
MEVTPVIRLIASVLTTAAVLGAALPGVAQTAAPAAPSTSCPAEPPRALAVAFGSGFYRDDLRQAALQAAADAARQAGAQLVAPQATALQSIPGAISASPAQLPATPGPTTLCAPTLVLVVSVGTMSGITAFITRYSEPVAVGGTLALPDGRIFTATSQQAASWYAGYLPAPYLPGLPVIIGGIPVGTPQAGAEQSAVQRGVAAALETLLANLPQP